MMLLSMAMKAYVLYLMKSIAYFPTAKEPDVSVSECPAYWISIFPQSGEMTFIKDPECL